MVVPVLVNPVEILSVGGRQSWRCAPPREALKEAKVITRLTVFMDGVEALAYLRREGY